MERSSQSFSDHAPLQHLQKQKHLSARQMRWMIRLAGHDYDIKYKPGQHNTVADALSRTINMISTIHTCPVFKETLLEKYAQDENLTKFIQTNNGNESDREYRVKDGLLYRHEKLVITGSELKAQLMKEAHEIPISGHMGIQKTLANLSRHVTWTDINTDVIEYIKHCETCQRIKASNKKPAGCLMPFEIPNSP